MAFWLHSSAVLPTGSLLRLCFRKPLGFISYRTEILPRNRERIMDEIVSFIGRDLLNPQYIISNLKNYDMAVMVVDYANNLGGRGKLKFAVRELVLQVISTLDTEKIGKSLAIALKSRRKKFQHGAVSSFSSCTPLSKHLPATNLSTI